MREFEQLTRLLSHRRSLILPGPVLPMDLWVIQSRFRQGSARGHGCKQFLVLFEQGIDDREHLASNPTNHTSSANIVLFSLIIAAFDGNQTLIESGPFTVHLNGMPNSQANRRLEQSRSSWGKPGTVQGCSRLHDGRNPTARRFELARMLKVGDVPNKGNKDGCLLRPDAWDRGQELSFTGMLNHLHHFGLQCLQMRGDESQFFNHLLLLEDQSALTRDILGANTLRCQPLQFQQFRVREYSGFASRLLKGRQTCGADGCGRGKAFPKDQGSRSMGIVENAGQFGKEFIADRSQLVLRRVLSVVNS